MREAGAQRAGAEPGSVAPIGYLGGREGDYESCRHRPVLNCAMDKTAIERDSASVEHHVRQGEQMIARQRDVITSLERGGHDTTQAKTLLGQLEENQALHIGHRDRLERQLVNFSRVQCT